MFDARNSETHPGRDSTLLFQLLRAAKGELEGAVVGGGYVQHRHHDLSNF